MIWNNPKQSNRRAMKRFNGDGKRRIRFLAKMKREHFLTQHRK